jgi:hypothetical protein
VSEIFRLLMAAMLSFSSVSFWSVRAAPAPLPPQVQPVLELVSPTVSPLCADSAIAVALIPGALKGVTLPPALYTLLGPVVVLCGSVPLPHGRYSCALDAAAVKQLAALSPTVGTLAPVLPAPLATLVQQVAYVENQVTPGSPLHLALTIAATIQCVGASAPPPSSSPSSLVPLRDTSIGVVTPSPAAPLPTAIPTAVPTVVPSAPSVPAAPLATLPPQAAAPIAIVSSGGFQYPAVILLPLLLLALVGYLVGAFTRPIPVRRGPARWRW